MGEACEVEKKYFPAARLQSVLTERFERTRLVFGTCFRLGPGSGDGSWRAVTGGWGRDRILNLGLGSGVWGLGFRA